MSAAARAQLPIRRGDKVHGWHRDYTPLIYFYFDVRADET